MMCLCYGQKNSPDGVVVLVTNVVNNPNTSNNIVVTNHSMHIHILGICGTFMGSLAVLAKQMGHRVTGSDQGVYPPMSTQLESQGIELTQGYDPAQLEPRPDLVVVGNAMSRGNPAVEYVLDKGIDYISGPQWLAEYVLKDRWTLAVSGTHGKTTTSTMLAWILEYAGMSPGFLIGGVPKNFETSARLGETPFFVVEADEYDSAFFDKRSKFVHYRPRTLIMNNLEFDHADIFADLGAIQTQFHHLLRTVPGTGRVIYPADDTHLAAVIARGCWSEQAPFAIAAKQTKSTAKISSAAWTAELLSDDGSHFKVITAENAAGTRQEGEVIWQMTGVHSVNNAIAAMMAAHHVGVVLSVAAEALSRFGGVKRRMELLAESQGVSIYDDFAHHPTAIATTLDGLRQKVGNEPIIALIEPRSNTMKMGVHKTTLLPSAEAADKVMWSNLSGMDWLPTLVKETVAASPSAKHQCESSVEQLLATTVAAIRHYRAAQSGCPVHVVIMSNGGFAGIHQKLIDQLRSPL